MPGPNAHMTLSPAGERFIKTAEEEGGKPKLKAYDDGTGTFTIGWGCTKGVHKGMTCTVAEAQAMFEREIATHIDEVHRLITVPITQGLFNALVSFFFNNGAGNCPTLIKAVNSGSETKTRQAFMLYVKAYNAKAKRKETWPGLVARRTAELSHWTKVDAEGNKQALSAWAPAVEPDKPNVLAIAAQSRSVWGLLVAAWTFVATWLTNLAHWIIDSAGDLTGSFGEIKDDVSSFIGTAKEVTAWFSLNWEQIATVIVLVCILIAIVRHANDKRALA